MKDATCGVKHDNMRLRRELVKKAIKAVEKKEQQSNRNVRNLLSTWYIIDTRCQASNTNNRPARSTAIV